MRNRMTFYPFLRRAFEDMAEVAEVLNRSTRYVQDRFNGKKEFTIREKRLIAHYLRIDEDTEAFNNLFILEVIPL